MLATLGRNSAAGLTGLTGLTGLRRAKLSPVQCHWSRQIAPSSNPAISPRLPFRTAQHPLSDNSITTQTLPSRPHSVHERAIRPHLDTIYALSTAQGRAAIAVIRISGRACLQIYQSFCPGQPLPRARTATVRKLYEPAGPDGSSAQILDSAALILYFPSPKTVTGEDVLELHTHGGPAIVKAVLKSIPSSVDVLGQNRHAHRIRYAEPGEFTRRAFYNNRLDLTQIEALGDSLSAETEQQRRLAVNGTTNELSARYEKWRNGLLHARGELEALIDFSEDQHFDEAPGEVASSVCAQVATLRREMVLHVRNGAKGELLRNGISVALLGAPNAGKSSLLNRIVGREAAIVSREEGTTRDIVDVSVDIGGWLCRLGDMAGLRSVDSANGSAPTLRPIGDIEREGMGRARARALASDLVVIMLSLEKAGDGNVVSLQVEAEVMDAVRECERGGKAMVVVVNKIDHLDGGLSSESEDRLSGEVRRLFPFIAKEDIFPISCLEAGHPSPAEEDPGKIQRLLRGLQSSFMTMTTPSGISAQGRDESYWGQSLAVSHRQSELLQQCLQHLDDFLSHSGSPQDSRDRDGALPEADLVAAAENLRLAADCLARMTGRGEAGDVEDVLGVVFEK